MKKIYDACRSGTLISSSNRKIVEIENEIEDDPVLKDRMINIKHDMRIAIEVRDDKLISKAVHDIYDISRILKKRKKYTNIYKKNEEEIAKEKSMLKNDPLGEENWND
jgi:hypothetical protein